MSVSLCAISGTLLDPSGIAIAGATVELRVTSAVFDSNLNLVLPFTTTATTDSSGNFSINAIQGLSCVLTLDMPPNSVDSTIRYAYSILVPASSTANISTLITET